MNRLSENDRSWGRLAAIAIATSGLIVGGALAASADSHEGGWKTTTFLNFEGQGETDLDAGGDFEYWMIAGGVKTGTMLTDDLHFSIGGDYRAVGYEFGAGVDPWETVHVMRLNPMLTYALSDNWFVTGGPALELSAEGGADVGDSLTGGGSGGVGYKFGKGSIALGVVVMSQLEDDAWVQPFIIVNYGFTDNLSLGMEATNSRGGEIRLTYAIGDSWEVGVAGGLRRERFRLDDDGGGASAWKDGVGEEEALVANVRVAYKINESMAIEAYGGTTIDGELRLETKTGKKILKSDYDNAGYGGLGLTFGF